MAAATPNGTFTRSGLSKDRSDAGRRSVRNPDIMRRMLLVVSGTRFLRTIMIAAIRPFTRIASTSTVSRFCAPRQAPRAPTNFQSPAPKMRIKTKGRSSAKPKPAPNRESVAPGQPRSHEFTPTPSKQTGNGHPVGNPAGTVVRPSGSNAEQRRQDQHFFRGDGHTLIASLGSLADPLRGPRRGASDYGRIVTQGGGQVNVIAVQA